MKKTREIPALTDSVKRSDYLIFIATSDEACLNAMLRILSSTGYKVVTCNTSDEVLSGMTSLQPALLVVDEDLTPLNGTQLVLQLLSGAESDRLPCLYLVRTNPGHWPVWALADNILGSIAFISKPFGNEEFIRLVDRLIQGIANKEFPARKH